MNLTKKEKEVVQYCLTSLASILMSKKDKGITSGEIRYAPFATSGLRQHRTMCKVANANFAHHAVLQNFLYGAKLQEKTSQSRRPVV